MSENEIVSQIHLYEYILKSHELNCEGIVALKMHVCKCKTREKFNFSEKRVKR